MTTQKIQDEVINIAPQTTKQGKDELYLYSLKQMAEAKLDENRVPFTGLLNLRSFFYLCGEMIKENQEKKFGVIVMDIAQFKAVNEFCGRSEGDKMLLMIGECFQWYEDNRPLTYVCHIRADNFCLCTAYENEKELSDIALHIRKQINEFPSVYRVLPSFGICASRDRAPAISYLKDYATVAMQSIKGKFYAKYAFFEEEMRTQMMREKRIESEVVGALERGDLVPYVQPKVDMETGRIIGGEALIRWKHPEKGLISPGEFIPVLEQNGFIIHVDEYIWEQIFKYLKKLDEDCRPLIPISINVSRVHAYDKYLCDTLLSLKEEYQIDPLYTPLELTESAFLANADAMYSRMQLLRSQGFSISIDDFGIGCSTMNMLRSQPVDEVKLDREFILDLDNEKSRIILEYNIQMLQALKMAIIFEGVETEAQKEFLLRCGCTHAQGYLFYKPMPLDEFDKLLRKQEMSDKENKN